MNSICIIDGNNYFRRRAETDFLGNPLRTCFKEIQAMPFDVVVLVWDGKGSLAARRAIYPEYKLRRLPPKEGMFEIQAEFKQLALLSKANSIELPGFEADDVIACITKEYKKLGWKIYIESNDADFAQLGVEMNRKEFKIPAHEVALYKTIKGDSSDNIKGIPNFGDSAWDKLLPEEKQQFMDILQEKPRSGTFTTLKPSVTKWLLEEENLKQLRAYWKIVNFIPIDFKSLKFQVGYNRDDLADDVLKSYMS